MLCNTVCTLARRATWERLEVWLKSVLVEQRGGPAEVGDMEHILDDVGVNKTHLTVAAQQCAMRPHYVAQWHPRYRVWVLGSNGEY